MDALLHQRYADYGLGTRVWKMSLGLGLIPSVVAPALEVLLKRGLVECKTVPSGLTTYQWWFLAGQKPGDIREGVH